jgi:hypothetical protein
MMYYSQRKSIKNGEAQAINNRFGGRADMERQYHLYCASAATNEAGNEVDSIEWGTVEQGKLEQKVWDWREATQAEVEEPAET